MKPKALIAEWVEERKAYRIYRPNREHDTLAYASGDSGLNEAAEWAKEHGYYVLEVRL